jgi:hypothetical protein
MDSNEPTAWEEINPMASARQPEQQLPSSERLVPATSDHFRNELTACLALVAPVGMTEENRRDWLAVAWGTLKHLPADILTAGCQAAREKCDHPSKIVPTIIAETKERMSWRQPTVYEQPQLTGPKPQYVTAAQAASILKEFGLKDGA